MLDNKYVFVTGGTGSIGSQVVRELLSRGAYVVIYSRDQNKQFKMNYEFSSKKIIYKNGDICDRENVERSMQGCQFVVHCAASKHVGLCEENVDSSLKVNLGGLRAVLSASLSNRIQKFLFLSSDKAVYPQAVMGMTKALGEKLVLEFNRYLPSSVIRLGNVFGSNGSVVPLFLDRIKHKLPLVINDPEAVRFFITPREAGLFITERLESMKGGEVFIKKMKWLTIKQLAESIAPVCYPMKIGTLAYGEKRAESLHTFQEQKGMIDHGDFVEINPFSSSAYEIKTEQFSNEEIKQMLKGVS